MREIVARDEPFVRTVVPREEAKSFFETEGRSLQGRTDRLHSAGRGPQALQPGRLDRPLPRAAHDLDRQGRRRLQADEGRRRLLARRFVEAHAVAHLRHRLRQEGGARRLPEADRGGRAARPPQARARDGPVPLPGGRAGLDLLASQGVDDLPDAHRLHAPPPRRRLSGGQRAAGARQEAVGDFRPLGLVSREHVHGAPRRRGGRGRGRARLRHQADELPGPRADLQERPEELSRVAAAPRRVRRRQPLRAVGRAARPHARARPSPRTTRTSSAPRSRWRPSATRSTI